MDSGTGTSSSSSRFRRLLGCHPGLIAGSGERRGPGPCKDPGPLVHRHLLAILDRPGLGGRLRTRATVEHVQALVEHEPVVAVAITVYVVFVAVLGIDEIEAPASEDPVATRAAVEGVVAVIPVEAVARAEAQEGVLLDIRDPTANRSPGGQAHRCERTLRLSRSV